MALVTRKPFNKTNLVVPIAPLEHVIDTITINTFGNDLIYDPSCHLVVVNA
jgi:hypothetical protein